MDALGNRAIVLIMLAGVLLLGGCPKGGDSAAAGGSGAWGNAPDVSFTTFDGQAHKLSDYAGQPVVLNFWAVWCPPCVKELPHFQDVYVEKAGQFELIAINVDGQQDPPGFFAGNSYTFTGGMDAGGAAQAYDVRGIPLTVFIDRSGNVVDKVVGGMERSDFEARLAKIL